MHTDVIEKVLFLLILAIEKRYKHVDAYNLIFPGEKRSSNAVYGRISPTLDQSLKKNATMKKKQKPHNRSHLSHLRSRRIWYMPRCARGPSYQSQSCSRLKIRRRISHE